VADQWLESMIEEIRLKEAELRNLKRAANTFYRSKELPPPFPDADGDEAATVSGPLRVRADEFYGKGFATAARLYLEKRKQAVPGEEIFRALESGGFDFAAVGWQEGGRLRSVAMSLAKNTAIFHRLPNGMFGLKDWYPEAIERKGKGKKNDDENGAISE
jgi:hypothetical protein